MICEKPPIKDFLISAPISPSLWKKNSIDFHDMWKARNKIFSYLRPHLPFSSIPLLRIANRLLSSQLFPGNKLLKMLKNIEKKNIEKYSSQLISCN